MPADLVPNLLDLLDLAIGKARTPAAAETLVSARERLDGPLRLAIAGATNTGKSTLLNALIGEELAATDAGECTRVVTWYEHGSTPRVLVHLRGRPTIHRPWRRESGALQIDLDGLLPEQIDHIEVSWPTSRLDGLTLVDTPGIGSISADVSARTHLILEQEDGRVPVVDAVLYLMVYSHADDVRFLEAFHDDDVAQATPINSIGVLARGDEIGSCRPDAMAVAARVAERYQRDRRLRRLCPVVVPVNGLLSFTAATLREREYQSLARLAAAPWPELEELLLTADRFKLRPIPGSQPEERENLIKRLGLFGVRISIDLIAHDLVHDSTELAEELQSQGGLDRLREVLARQFTARSRVLKARSALAALTGVLQVEGCADASVLAARVEEMSVGAHDFAELRLLTDVRNDLVELKPQLLVELDQVLGGGGHDPRSRVGLAETATEADVRTAAMTALARWQRTAEHPLTSRSGRVAARVATRTLEGLLSVPARSG